ncbi:IS5 family transposase [Amycolatopsis sp. cmx-11-12]|uniref:IS5 family transposase n=1 Tax=Amycolatopsis sp. cmx-11-12 TaxID=2785795 RepID=UPI003917D706
MDDRKAWCGIMFVLYPAIPWESLPQKLGYRSGMTCWRQLRDWTEAGVWQQLHELLLAELHAANLLDWSRVVDGSHVRALKGAGDRPLARSIEPVSGPSTMLITDGTGILLEATLTGGNRHDVTQLMPLIHAILPVRGRPGPPRRRPRRIYADRAYDHDNNRRLVRATGITPVIARRGQEHSSGLGVSRTIEGDLHGNILRAPARQGGKISVLAELSQEIDIDWGRSLAIVDSSGDADVLGAVGFPVAFRP